MQQPVPKVTESDVSRIVARDFSADEIARAHAILNDYGMESWEREIARVRVAALKLAAGSLEALRSHVKVAKSDYRDVLAAAEYPAYMSVAFRSHPPADGEMRISTDWEQYREWFERG